jgi:hypothetical protein
MNRFPVKLRYCVRIRNTKELYPVDRHREPDLRECRPNNVTGSSSFLYARKCLYRIIGESCPPLQTLSRPRIHKIAELAYAMDPNPRVDGIINGNSFLYPAVHDQFHPENIETTEACSVIFRSETEFRTITEYGSSIYRNVSRTFRNGALLPSALRRCMTAIAHMRPPKKPPGCKRTTLFISKSTCLPRAVSIKSCSACCAYSINKVCMHFPEKYLNYNSNRYITGLIHTKFIHRNLYYTCI